MSETVCSEGKGKESIKRCHDRHVVLVCCCPPCYFLFRKFQKRRGEARLISGCGGGVEAEEVQDSTCGHASTERPVQTKREREAKTTTAVHSSREYQKRVREMANSASKPEQTERAASSISAQVRGDETREKPSEQICENKNYTRRM